MKKVLIIDTSVLCVWIGIPGMECCGKDGDRWDKARVDEKIRQEHIKNTTFVLPVASIIETGNHIVKAPRLHWECANLLANLLLKIADEESPWAAFADQTSLWTPEHLRNLAGNWPEYAKQKISLGDMTIKDVAELYHKLRYSVEILTGDNELKAYEPLIPVEIPRRRQR